MAMFTRTGIDGPTPTTEPNFIPVSYATEIIAEAAKSSMALASFRQIRMPSKVHQLPVLDTLPTASWIAAEPNPTTGVGGKKPTTTMAWTGVMLTAEEIAAIAVIPEAVLEDSSIDLWAEITPRIAEAIAVSLDRAVFAGTNAPASFGGGIIPSATTATNVTTGTDVQSYSDAFALVEADGFDVSVIYSALTGKAGFRAMNASGVPIYLSDWRDDGRTDSLFGVPVLYDDHSALGAALAVVGDPTKAIIGVRTDMQVKVLTEASIDISAALDGSAIVNLAQQDSVGLRVRARFGFAVANPETYANTNNATRYPFAVLNAA